MLQIDMIRVFESDAFRLKKRPLFGPMRTNPSRPVDHSVARELTVKLGKAQHFSHQSRMAGTAA